MSKCKDRILASIETVPFANTLVKRHPAKYDAVDFITKETIIHGGSFSVSCVVGTDHPDYCDKTWKEFLLSLKRSDRLNILNCDATVPSILYYTDLEYRNKMSSYDPWSIDIVNGAGYIEAGNHRTCIAKFLAALTFIPDKQYTTTQVRHIDYNEKLHKQYKAAQKYIEIYGLSEDIELKVRRILTMKETLDNNTTISEYSTSFELCNHYEDKEMSRYIVSQCWHLFDDFDNLKKKLKQISKKRNYNNLIAWQTNKLKKYILKQQKNFIYKLSKIRNLAF